MKLAITATFADLKQAVLAEHNYTSRMYYKTYLDAIRAGDESMTQYAGRLRILFNLYLESRSVNNSCENLVKLILADRLKSTLSTEIRYYISDLSPS